MKIKEEKNKKHWGKMRVARRIRGKEEKENGEGRGKEL